MVGTILLEDLERANDDELRSHLSSLFAPVGEAVQGVGQALAGFTAPGPPPAAAMPTPSDSLTNPAVRPAPPPDVPAGPEPTPHPITPLIDDAQAAWRTGDSDSALAAIDRAIDALRPGGATANAIGEFIQPTSVREGQQALAQTTPEQQADLLGQMTSGNALEVLGRSGLGGPSEGEPLSRQRREAFETTDVSKVPVLGGVLGAVVEDPSALLPIGGGAKVAAETPEVAALARRAGRPIAEFLRNESGEFDPHAVATAARQAIETAPDAPPGISWDEWLKAIRYNSMLSSPRTLEINTLSNALEIPWRFARDTGASLVRGRPEELRPEIDGLRMGLQSGARAFRDAWMNGTTDDIATESSQLLAPRAKNALERGAANALDLTSRTLGATDQWAQAIAQGMSLGRQAGVQASREGLHGEAWQTRVAELMEAPTADMLDAARQVSRRMVYQNDMGDFGNALKGVQDTPIGNVVLPFLKTVYNLASRGIDRSPAGLVATGKDVAMGKYGRSRRELADALGSTTGPGKGAMPLGERLGDAIMGTGATLAFYQAAMGGTLTGEGPDDREKRDMLRAQGWQPYSIKVGDQYVSYANWGPVATSLSMAAAAAEAQTFRKTSNFEVQNLLLDAAKRTAGIVTEQSYLQGIGTIWKALEEPEKYAPQAVAQYVTSLIPYGAALNTVGQGLDDVQRQASRFGDVSPGQYLAESVETRLPGLRESLPPLQDQLGRDVPNERAGLLGALNPLRTSTVRRNEVLNQLLQSGVDVGEPVDTFKGMPLTPAEQRQVNRASGPLIEQYVRQTMNDPKWSTWEAEDRRAALSKSVAAARQQAAGQLVDQLGTKEFERRLAAERAKKAPAGIAGP